MSVSSGVPEGYRTLSPYLVVTGAQDLVDFVSRCSTPPGAVE